MDFYCPMENPNVVMRENHNIQSCENIIIYHDELYVASITPEEILHSLQDKYKINIYLHTRSIFIYSYKINIHMILVKQIFVKSRNILKSYENVNMLFNDKLPTDLHISFKIIKLLIKKGNLNLIHNKKTYVHFNHVS